MMAQMFIGLFYAVHCNYELLRKVSNVTRHYVWITTVSTVHLYNNNNAMSLVIILARLYCGHVTVFCDVF